MTISGINSTFAENNQEWTTDDLVKALESMAFRHGEAGEMVSHAAPRLKAGITLEEAIRLTLQGRRSRTKS